MARITGIGDTEAGLLARQVFKGAKRRAGMVPDPLRIMAHCPPVMFAAGTRRPQLLEFSRAHKCFEHIRHLLLSTMSRRNVFAFDNKVKS